MIEATTKLSFQCLMGRAMPFLSNQKSQALCLIKEVKSALSDRRSHISYKIGRVKPLSDRRG